MNTNLDYGYTTDCFEAILDKDNDTLLLLASHRGTSHEMLFVIEALIAMAEDDEDGDGDWEEEM